MGYLLTMAWIKPGDGPSIVDIDSVFRAREYLLLGFPHLQLRTMPLAHSFRNSVVSLPSPSPNTLTNCKFPVVDVAHFIAQLDTVQDRESTYICQ